jgi:hypothetical protein
LLPDAIVLKPSCMAIIVVARCSCSLSGAGMTETTGMEWGDLRVFLAIAREGTLGAAARELGQTQPTMGRRLRALEAAVGHTLFQRTANGSRWRGCCASHPPTGSARCCSRRCWPSSAAGTPAFAWNC